MRDFAVFCATVLYVGAIIWAYMNRDSEKVVTTLFLGVTALIGSLAAVAFFGSEPPIRKVFSTAIMVDAKTCLPFERLPFQAPPSVLTIQAREKLKAHPGLIPDPKTDPFAQTLYHNLLQRSIIYWMEQKYPKTWEAEVFPMNLGESSGYTFQSIDAPSRLYLKEELATKMSGNTFADVAGPFSLSNQFGLAIPKGTELELLAPHRDPTLGEVSVINLRNRFCKIKIETRSAMSMVGAGSYRMLLGMNQDQAQEAIKTDQYTIIISATFNRLLSGHPEMPKYKKWASDIADGLQAQFDERVMWTQTKEWLLLHRAESRN